MKASTSQGLPSPWLEFLDELDEALSESVELHCIGGFVISLLSAILNPDWFSQWSAVSYEPIEKPWARIVSTASLRLPASTCFKIRWI